MGKLLFRIARLKIIGTLIGFVIAYLPFLVPAKKIIQTKSVVSFYHPSPSYPGHILIIPRRVARTVFDLSAADFVEAVSMATEICQDKIGNYSLLINGGEKQDVMQAHFHLFAGNVASQRGLNKESGLTLSHDNMFWEQIIYNLANLLSQNNISEKSFSILIQFEGSNKPIVYFI